ncbi:Uncharacterised protein [Mycobacteroides abscessus subsp. abscessus]|nr:Uncharacterised protein [Mycobacteroides abscessus subsp. abscessus]
MTACPERSGQAVIHFATGRSLPNCYKPAAKFFNQSTDLSGASA